MTVQAFRAVCAALALLVILPQLAAGQIWRVHDTVTNQEVFPATTVSVLEDVSPPFIAHRVYRISNVSTTSQQIGPCSIVGHSSLSISIFPYPAGQQSGSVFPGLPTSIAVQHASNSPGTHEATVRCSGAGGLNFRVRGRLLDPNPYIILETLAGTNVAKNSTFNFGSAQAGVAADRDFRIINLGNQALTVSLTTTNPAYSVVVPPPSSIAKGSEATFRLRLLSAASGTVTGQLRIANNDPNDNPYNVNLTASVSAAPAPQIQITDNGNGGTLVAKGSTVNLGSTSPNTVLLRTFTLRNTGNATLSITNRSSFVSGTGFSLSTFPSTTVGAGSTTTFTVRFQAATSTSYQGTVSIASNDPDDNPFFFNLAVTVGSAPAPRIRVVDNLTGQTVAPGGTVSFGTPAPNVSVTRSFTLHNDGTGALTLSNPGSFVSGSGFSISSSPSSSIPAGSSSGFSIRFLGSAAGPYSGSASLLHNDTTVTNPLAFNLHANVQTPLPTVALSVVDAETSETPSNNGSVLLSRTGSTAAALSVNLAVSGTAVNGVDYAPIATTQTFAVGQSSLTLAVIPVNDTAIEDVETVVLALAAGSGYNVGSPSSATITLYNDDFTACTPAATRLCLQGGRFEATLSALSGTTPYTGQAIPLTNSSGGFWLFSPNNVEVGVKVLDAAALAGKMWVFHGAATNVAYTLTVVDRANPSRVRTFSKAAGSFCGGADTEYFVKSAGLLEEEEAALSFDAVPASSVKAFTCVPTTTTTCLLGNRFQVRVKLGTVYQPGTQATSQTGFFWFNNADNQEVFVKLLDGTPVNGKYWVFLGAMTNQAYTVEVTDSVTSVLKTYTSAGPFCGQGDTAAF